MTEAVTMRHDPATRRFVAEIDGTDEHAVLDYRAAGDGTLEYYRTFTPETLRGRGIGGRLVEHALDHALANGLYVVPTCPFVAAVARRDKKYDAVIVGLA